MTYERKSHRALASARSALHRWNNGDTCIREGAGAGPYGAMRYYRDEQKGYDYKPGSCPGGPT